MTYNMNFYDIGLRYLAGYLIVMLGAVLQTPAIMFLGIPFFIVALLGMSPLFYFLGIDHSVSPISETAAQDKKQNEKEKNETDIPYPEFILLQEQGRLVIRQIHGLPLD